MIKSVGGVYHDDFEEDKSCDEKNFNVIHLNIVHYLQTETVTDEVLNGKYLYLYFVQ